MPNQTEMFLCGDSNNEDTIVMNIDVVSYDRLILPEWRLWGVISVGKHFWSLFKQPSAIA